MCIGLKVAHECNQFDIDFFNKSLMNLKKINGKTKLDFYSKVLLDNTLKLVDYCLKTNEEIIDHYVGKHEEYDLILSSGLMSKNNEIRKIYSTSIEKIVEDTVESKFIIFEIFFNLIYRNF
jgi:hypothetical protein